MVSLKFKEDKWTIVPVCAGPSRASRGGVGWDVGVVHLPGVQETPRNTWMTPELLRDGFSLEAEWERPQDALL